MLQIYSPARLTAAADSRTVRGLLIPFGEPGFTNKGRVKAMRGKLKVPEGSTVFLNIEHDRRRPIGKATRLTETKRGIEAEFHIANTAAGRDALAEIAEGLRASLSIEIDNPVIRKGRILGGAITGAALVAEPAFPSALLTAAIPDQGELEEISDEAEETTGEIIDAIELLEDTAESIDAVAKTADPTTTETDIEEEMKDEETENNRPLTSARAQIGGLAAAAPQRKHHGMEWLLANLAGQTRDRRLHAALSDVVPTDVLGVEQPQYIGELWDGKEYERKIIPLFAHADLTSFKVQGWRWEKRPEVASYKGDKTDVPSNAVSTKSVEIEAKRIAGAHDIDRKFRDFPNEEFWQAYFAAMTESYARQSDALVLADVKKAAKRITAKTRPAGIAQGLVSVVDGALAIMNETDTVPTAAVVATDLWRDIILTPNDNVLGYLNAAMGLEDGTLGTFPIIPSAALEASETLVVTRPAVTVHELAGSPIRVEAIDVARGGIDQGVFGYYAVNVHEPGGLVLVTPKVD